jgi:hypothetical protein
LFVSEEGAGPNRFLNYLELNNGVFTKTRLFGQAAIGACTGMPGGGIGSGTPVVFDSLWGLMNDGDHTIYGFDRYQHVAYKFDLPAAFDSVLPHTWLTSALTASKIAGTCGSSGTAAQQKLDSPAGGVFFSDHLLSVQLSGDNVRAVALPGGTISDYPATFNASDFTFPRDMVSAPDGTLYVADTDGHRVVKVTSGGGVTGVIGVTATGSFVTGNSSTARLKSPSGIALDPFGDLIVVDHDAYCIGRIRL